MAKMEACSKKKKEKKKKEKGECLLASFKMAALSSHIV